MDSTLTYDGQGEVINEQIRDLLDAIIISIVQESRPSITSDTFGAMVFHPLGTLRNLLVSL